ncbi:hypothetical protein [Pontibacter flavimaris]|uniref:Uncharacterized protein n=1 Tax=Pontibacter flavimaris TaxID=1797110 RepID=A0A1Q5P8B7_9BACT|nr:hypothetical protein [Pontibacter flavimaris]OKL38433.1 hypothetical protein A3841_06875 [Pontibacter flavimaris]
MNYNDLRTEELFVEASAIRFYMRQEGWVNRGEMVGYKEAYTPEADRSETDLEHHMQPGPQRNWIEWVRSL